MQTKDCPPNRGNPNYLARVREATIENLPCGDRPRVVALFRSFEKVLGPVGAAKALHLLAPRLFPLWDGAIARKYRVGLKKAGQNGEGYWAFMQICRRQCEALGAMDGNPLKALDEYNYGKYTKEWF